METNKEIDATNSLLNHSISLFIFPKSMSARLRNFFFLLGLGSVVIMVVNFDMPLEVVTANLLKAGHWFVWACLLWVGVYSINALAWRAIIHDGNHLERIPFWRILKFTITGFSLNCVTPVGLMGGEPYRIMELKPYSPAKFIHRGGRIPAPIHSLKN